MARLSAKRATAKQTLSKRAGLVFPARRVHKKFKSFLNGPQSVATKHSRRKAGKIRVGNGAAVYATAVLEYLAAEVMELAGLTCKDNYRKRITPRHMMMAIRMDEELNKLLKDVIFPSAGVIPRIDLRHVAQNTVKVNIQPNHAATAKLPISRNKAASKKPVPVPAPQRSSSGKGITTLSERVLQSTGAKITVLSGDIVNIRADGFVVPSSSNFSLGGQVGQRVAQHGGQQLQGIMAKLTGTIPESGASVCTAGPNFVAGKIIFCNGPSWGRGANQAECLRQLIQTVNNCLELASAEKMATVALPSIGSGVASFPKQLAAQMILQTISDYFKTTAKTNLKNVFFVLHDQQSINIYVKELKNLIE